ncbi:hypothetical protein A1O3_05212 [Capronia epimyces CBS 606.96]|uniref:GATA-type domain-containing protein n=1 Tax=Capronia epimyces CBS 606.96 TaxID=1182542 RepID=W9XWE0_9EURO|nr:uncharacterized protein A1O3_05212 [Capronia epimyces CBS 606.96]EXJ84543.1 hypothetical protein A1O3_05212 [Capronia epimyces CBS 606.96]
MASSPAEGVSIRTIRLKVLYTFDVEQKDNHLARWPHPVDVQTAFVDDLNQIGVIDLRTCLEAITTASPELTTHPENDYTVYAYDYSEPDTPLVGQGMLSRALANQDQGAGGDNEAMVTGKLTKNVMGLFSKNAQEMLEVRLRLTPVSTFAPARYRSGSVSSQDGSRPQWSNSSSTQTMPSSTSPVDTSGLEAMQRMLSRENVPSSGPISRPGTPNASQILNAPTRQAGTSSRPSSRAGTRQTTSHARRDSFNSGYYSGDENVEDGPARKRAKITKVDWPTKSDLNIERQPESLRVAASIASSVRLQRPIAINPAITTQGILSTEEPVRPPTPVPASRSKPRGRSVRPRKNPLSNLVHGAQIRGSSPSPESAPRPDLLNIPVASPEDTRARSLSSTPANIPSSPPVMPEQQHSMITSPALPPLADHGHDSGFLSETLDELFGDDQTLQFEDFIIDKPDGEGCDETRERSKNTANLYPLVFGDGNVFEDRSAIQPKPHMIPPPLPMSSRPVARAQSYTPALRTSTSSPRLAPAPIPRARQIMEEQRDQQRMKTIAPAPLPKSDPPARMFQRSQTWAPDSDALMSDAPTGEESRAKAASRKKVGKEQTKARLENAIANGEMPPFCDNCGSIETPAWRRAYAKTFDCAWDDVETSLDQGECCYKEILAHNPDGSVKTFRGYKVERRPGDEVDEWTSITLCNPCGLWFHKQKCPRPPEKWQKKDPKERGKRKRNTNSSSKAVKKANGNSNLKSDAQTPASDDSSPADFATEAPDAEENENEATNNDDYMADNVEPQLPQMPHTFRASSAEPGPRGLQASFRHRAHGRQVQSSPGQAHGSEGVPIEIDLTPKPVRRQLFPSPDKVQVRSDPGPATSSSKATISLPAFVRRSPRLNKTRDVFALSAGVVEISADGKENIAPAPAPTVVDDGLADLFEEGPADVELPPMTPTPKRRSERLLLKTPSKTPQRQFGAGLSPNAGLHPNFRTPKAKSATHPALTALLGTAHKDVLEMTPFSRSIHDALTSDLPLPLELPEENKSLLRGSSKKSTPNKALCFDFPDLPSLKNSSPMSNEQLVNFSFSELTTDQLHSDCNDPFHANVTMPSSPPPGLFSFLDTHEHALWDGMLSVNGTPHDGQPTYPDPDTEGLTGTTKLSHLLRRSPRKPHAQ